MSLCGPGAQYVDQVSWIHRGTLASPSHGLVLKACAISLCPEPGMSSGSLLCSESRNHQQNYHMHTRMHTRSHTRSLAYSGLVSPCDAVASDVPSVAHRYTFNIHTETHTWVVHGSSIHTAPKWKRPLLYEWTSSVRNIHTVEWCSATEPSKVRKPVEAGVLTIAKWKKSVAKDYHFCAAVAGISRIGKLTETESRRRLPRGRGGVAGSGEWLTWCTVSFCAFGALWSAM